MSSGIEYQPDRYPSHSAGVLKNKGIENERNWEWTEYQFKENDTLVEE